MAVRVNIEESGVVIENVLRKTKFTLDHTAWENLVGCSEEVSKAIEAKKTTDWMLQPDKNIRINTNVFNKIGYFHIREWYKDYPTRKGISFYEKDWAELSEHFTTTEENKLAKEVMATMLRLEAKNLMSEECEGCVKSYGSQRDHDCLMNAALLARKVMDKIDIRPQNFILMLAQEALNQGLVLRRPHEAFVRVKRFHMDAIKDAVIESDYTF